MLKKLFFLYVLLLAVPAQAGLIDISYTGAVTTVGNPNTAVDVSVGDHISVNLRYNDNDLIDVSNAPSLPQFGADTLPGLQVASLSGPSDNLTVTIGSHVFTARDDFDFGNNAGLDGFPAFPLVVFLNGQLLGVEFLGVFNDDLDFNLLAIERILLPDIVTADVIGSDFNTGEYAFQGTLNVTDALITPVDEPWGFPLMLLGIGMFLLAFVQPRQCKITSA